MRDLDDEPGREGLPGQLSDGRDGADEGVLVSREVGILLEVEDGAGAEDSLVEDLGGRISTVRYEKGFTVFVNVPVGNRPRLRSRE